MHPLLDDCMLSLQCNRLYWYDSAINTAPVFLCWPSCASLTTSTLACIFVAEVGSDIKGGWPVTMSSTAPWMSVLRPSPSYVRRELVGSMSRLKPSPIEVTLQKPLSWVFPRATRGTVNLQEMAISLHTG